MRRYSPTSLDPTALDLALRDNAEPKFPLSFESPRFEQAKRPLSWRSKSVGILAGALLIVLAILAAAVAVQYSERPQPPDDSQLAW